MRGVGQLVLRLVEFQRVLKEEDASAVRTLRMQET
jgi:hypothetical protein